MLQTVNTQGHAGWNSSIVNPILGRPETWKRSIHTKRKADSRRTSVSDIALLYPEAVVVSSDAFAWQDTRVIQLRHSLNEMVLAPSDNHCLVLNLSTPLDLHARLGQRNFEGRVGAGEVAIIPAGTTWSCQSHGSHLRNTLLLFLRPLFVRSAVAEFDLSYKELDLTPQIGFQSKHIHHIGMSQSLVIRGADRHSSVADRLTLRRQKDITEIAWRGSTRLKSWRQHNGCAMVVLVVGL